MLKARNRKLSMILVLAMLMTMFAGLGTASAADIYSVSGPPTVAKDATGVKLGTITVTFPDFQVTDTRPGATLFADNLAGFTVTELVYFDKGFVVKLPDGFKIKAVGGDGLDASKKFPDGGADSFAVIKPLKDKGLDKAKVLVVATEQANRIKVFVQSIESVEELKFYLPITADTPASVPSEVRAGIAKEPGSVFVDNLGIVVGTAETSSVEAIANDPISVEHGEKVKISVRANTNDSLKTLSFKLPAGFTWRATPEMERTGLAKPTATLLDSDRTVKFSNFPANHKGIWSFEGIIQVDETRAKFGDVVVSLSGSNVKPSSVTIGTYSDFGVEVTASETPSVLAGRTEVEIADIQFKELAKGSLINGRTVYMTLPDGVRWMANAQNELVCDTPETENIGINGSIEVFKNKPEMAKFVITNDNADKGSIKIPKAQVEIAPDYTGDIVVEFSGSAGVDGDITVATVEAPVTVSAEVKDVKIGLQGQEGGTIVITEAKAEALTETAVETYVYNNGQTQQRTVNAWLVLRAPQAVQWAKVPTVEVIEGDLEIGEVTRTDNNRNLEIRIKETSTTPSKIEISDVAWTVDRTVPEGDMKVSVLGNSVVKAVFTNRTAVTSFVAANVVTPAPGETVSTCEFRIGSNIYYAGGVAKVMDVAPYIKNDRTYVPMRYMGETLGAEVVWDEAARTVTLTKDETTVVFTIGSTTYTVNGEAKTADVAPEIVNDRTMLPARFVAEAFGAVVGWDAATQTVLIQK